jgi:DNA-binding beta-propeller fold protein YncE
MTSTMKTVGLFASAWVFAACSGGGDDACPEESGTACVWAGTGERGFNKDTPTAHRLDSQLYFPHDLTFGPDGRGYILDYNNHRIRRVEANDALITVVGTDYEGDGAPQMQDRLPLCNPEGAIGTTVAMNHPTDAVFGPDGLLYIAAWHNNKIRVYDPATDIVTTLAGDGYGFAGDGGPGCMALFNQPDSVVVAPDGTIYTIDQRNVRIRVIAPEGNRTITTIAGDGTIGDTGDGGPALEATFGFEIGTTPRPSGALVLDGRTLYIADSLNHRIRRIDLDTGVIDCIAGTPEPGYSGDGGPALEAQLNFPVDMELGPDGRLYVADRYNHAVRAIDLTTGIIDTVVGNGAKCSLTSEACADGLAARDMRLNEPYGIEFDLAGNLYVADSHNHRILKVAR